MANTVEIDPVTRLEGHLRVKLTLEAGKVVSAWCSGTSFRGFENVLLGRPALEAPHIVQRICGICPVAHAEASLSALEAAMGAELHPQARIQRSILLASEFIASHVLHFYHLALLDFVHGPDRPPWAPRIEFGPRFSSQQAAGLWDSYVEAFLVRRHAHSIGAAVGGRLPHAVAVFPGGACAAPGPEAIADMKDLASVLLGFVQGRYADDLGLLQEKHPELEQAGAGGSSYLSCGRFAAHLEAADGPFVAGVVLDGQAGAPDFSALVQEEVAFSRYKGSSARPAEGATEPDLASDGKYSFVKAPRYAGKPCEVGPYARALIAASEQPGLGVMARHRARMAETLDLALRLGAWIEMLEPGAGPTIQSRPVFPDNAQTLGLVEAPRGMLGHWVALEGGRIASYQVVSPTTWFASPRDSAGVPGPLEQALVGLEVADPANPIEALRVIHSFDPCMQCSVH